jgi:hypothetical protein
VSPFFCTTLGPQEEIGRTQQLRSERGRPNRVTVGERARPRALPTRRPAAIDHTQAGYGVRMFVMASACFAPPQTRWCVLVDVESARLDR